MQLAFVPRTLAREAAAGKARYGSCFGYWIAALASGSDPRTARGQYIGRGWLGGRGVGGALVGRRLECLGCLDCSNCSDCSDCSCCNSPARASQLAFGEAFSAFAGTLGLSNLQVAGIDKHKLNPQPLGGAICLRWGGVCSLSSQAHRAMSAPTDHRRNAPPESPPTKK